MGVRYNDKYYAHISTKWATLSSEYNPSVNTEIDRPMIPLGVMMLPATVYNLKIKVNEYTQ